MMKPYHAISLVMVMVVALAFPEMTIAQDRPTAQITIEQGTNRPGKDYRNVELRSADPQACADLCRDDPNCRAFTYVKPGVQGSNARCWLKNAVPGAVTDPNCVSGVRVMLKEQPRVVTQPPTGPGGLVEAIPINLPMPRPDLLTRRADQLNYALQQPAVAAEISRLAQTNGLTPTSLQTNTLARTPARAAVDAGRNKQYLPGGVKPAGVPSTPDGIDWSGGMQLTPRYNASGEAFWKQGEMKPVASMSIAGIFLAQAGGLEAMVQNNTVWLYGNGAVHLQLYLPDKEPTPYLVTVDYVSYGGYTTPAHVCLQRPSYGGLEYPLTVSSDKKRLVGVAVLEPYGPDNYLYLKLEIRFSNGGYFSGVTFTKL